MTNYGEDERFLKELEKQKIEDFLWNQIPSVQECGWSCVCGSDNSCEREILLTKYKSCPAAP